MDTEKLNRWAKEIHDNATAHGWHEEKHSPEHYLALVMCEVAEAIEADRQSNYFKDYIFMLGTTCSQLNRQIDKDKFDVFYKNNVKGTVEEEFADIVIRLLDMAVELHGNDFVWKFPEGWISPNKNLSVCDNAWIFVRYSLDTSIYHIGGSICFVYEWAEQLGIDLDQHIEWKMKYNESRPYKHGGKKY